MFTLIANNLCKCWAHTLKRILIAAREVKWQVCTKPHQILALKKGVLRYEVLLLAMYFGVLELLALDDQILRKPKLWDKIFSKCRYCMLNLVAMKLNLDSSDNTDKRRAVFKHLRATGVTFEPKTPFFLG